MVSSCLISPLRAYTCAYLPLASAKLARAAAVFATVVLFLRAALDQHNGALFARLTMDRGPGRQHSETLSIMDETPLRRRLGIDQAAHVTADERPRASGWERAPEDYDDARPTPGVRSV